MELAGTETDPGHPDQSRTIQDHRILPGIFDGQLPGWKNLLNYVQENPIIASEDPFGPWFDASLIWGPIFGRKFYAGLRFRIS